ncbi:hypothetical protein B5G09_01980 [Alistipes sp. An54]|uniref:GIN domain-containing protein n=1 Tax=Alistipes sp. An54 TaxID=1965645 RepID=UPI000B39DB74|nr:DUF2807 domain-containing protein [Alistipes sp. An54]OUN79125.1 hypothetical protein B5G09_01980 [Alistipes sp. An54]
MKKFLWIIPILAVVAAACLASLICFAKSLSDNRIIKASGNIVTKEIPIPEFNAINTSRAVKVVLTEQGDKIRIDADENLMAWVVVEPEDGELQVTIDRQIKSINNSHVTVTIPVQGRTFRSLRASSAAKIRGKEVELKGADLLVKASSAAKIETSVKAGSCSIDASSAADIDLTVKAATCNIEASSAASVRADIQSKSCTADASSAAGITLKGLTEYFESGSSSAGKVNASELTAQRADVTASSGSKTLVNCTESLKASASSGAGIRYTGDCQVETSESSGGSIRRK